MMDADTMATKVAEARAEAGPPRADQGMVNGNLASGGHKLSLLKVHETGENTRGFDWGGKDEADRFTERATEWEEARMKVGADEDPRAAMRAAQAARDAHEEASAKVEVAKAKVEAFEEDSDDFLSDSDDDGMLAAYRAHRIAQMKAAQRGRFGELYHIGEAEYGLHVKDESCKDQVVLLLFKEQYEACQCMVAALSALAKRHRDVKFCKMLSTDANRDFPDSKLPAVFVYRDREIEARWFGLQVHGSSAPSDADVERSLAEAGVLAIRSTDET